MATTRKARSKRAMNPLVTLRAQTIQSKKHLASKRACRGPIKESDKS